MKNSIIILLMIYSFTLTSYHIVAQSWEILPSKTSIKLNDAYFFDRDTGLVCGDKGLIMKTTNGGYNWQVVKSGSTDKLAGFFFINRNIGYASGFVGNGTLLKTTDGGNTWQNVSLNYPDTRSASVWFTSPSVGYYAIGNKFYQNSVVLKTTDGGLNWDTVFTGTKWISYLFFINEQIGFATASGSDIYHTQNGGTSWDTTHFPCDMWMSGIYFLNKDTGFVSGLDMGSNCMTIMATYDGGKKWLEVSDSGASRIYFKDKITGYAIYPDTSGHGLLMKTINQGKNWFVEPTPKKCLASVFFPESEIGYAVCDSGFILKYSKKYTTKGVIKFKGNPVDAGHLKLFSFSRNQKSVLIDSIAINSGGIYEFDSILTGKYLLLVNPDTILYPNASSTYYGNTLLWSDATIIYIYANDTINCDINLIEKNNIPAGMASISGVVSTLDGTRAGTSPIKDVDVTLKKVPGGEIKKDKSNDTGSYKFENLPMGDYVLFIDIPGLPMDSLMPVKVNDQDTSVRFINFGVDSTGIHIDISLSVDNEKMPFNVVYYPNPLHDKIHLNFANPGNYQIEMIAINGNILNKYYYSYTSSILIDLSEIPNSVYILKISNEKASYIVRLIKQ